MTGVGVGVALTDAETAGAIGAILLAQARLQCQAAIAARSAGEPAVTHWHGTDENFTARKTL